MMRTHLLLAAALLAALTPAAGAQRSRRSDSRPQRSSESSSSFDYRFTPAIRAGQRLEVSNVDGDMVITQGRGTTAEIVVHKTVRRGDGDRVKAVLEETPDGYRVCTVYLDRADDSDRGCEDRNRNGNNNGRRDPLDVEMRFEVRLPAGVVLNATTVDGNLEARGMDQPATLRTVDGNITFEGVAPSGLNTVDGAITATITNARWDRDVHMRSVDGGVDVTLPAGMSLTISGSTVDGDIKADFPVTLAGKWGPRSFRASIGDGGSRELVISTVDGSIHLHQRGRE